VMKLFTKKRRGIATAIIAFVAMLLIVGLLYIVLNTVVGQYEAMQTLMPTVLLPINADTNSFMISLWTWVLVLFVFAGAIYVYRDAQKRGYSDVY